MYRVIFSNTPKADPACRSTRYQPYLSPRESFENLRLTFGNGRKSSRLVIDKLKKSPNRNSVILLLFTNKIFSSHLHGLTSFLDLKYQSNVKTTTHYQTHNNNCTFIFFQKCFSHSFCHKIDFSNKNFKSVYYVLLTNKQTNRLIRKLAHRVYLTHMANNINLVKISRAKDKGKDRLLSICKADKEIDVIYMIFKFSLIIHKENTKEINV